MKTGRCARCGRDTIDGRTYTTRPDLRDGRKPHGGRGLCKTCYTIENEAGRLDRWSRVNRRREDLIIEWDLLRSAGVGLVEAARRIGVKPATLDRALHRGLATGDDRARHTGCPNLRNHPRTGSGLTRVEPGV